MHLRSLYPEIPVCSIVYAYTEAFNKDYCKILFCKNGRIILSIILIKCWITREVLYFMITCAVRLNIVHWNVKKNNIRLVDNKFILSTKADCVNTSLRKNVQTFEDPNVATLKAQHCKQVTSWGQQYNQTECATSQYK